MTWCWFLCIAWLQEQPREGKAELRHERSGTANFVHQGQGSLAERMHGLAVGHVDQGGRGSESDESDRALLVVTFPDTETLPPGPLGHLGPSSVGVGGPTQMWPAEPPLLLLSWLAPEAALGRRRQASVSVGGWTGARGTSRQIEWEGDNVFF